MLDRSSIPREAALTVGDEAGWPGEGDLPACDVHRGRRVLLIWVDVDVRARGISARKLTSEYAVCVSLKVLPRTQMFRG